MGMFDYFSNGKETVQLKIGPCTLDMYNIGDYVETECKDGAYQGSGRFGWVVITNNKVEFVTEAKELPEGYARLECFNNYGEPVDVLTPIEEATQKIIDEYKDKV